MKITCAGIDIDGVENWSLNSNLDIFHGEKVSFSGKFDSPEPGFNLVEDDIIKFYLDDSKYYECAINQVTYKEKSTIFTIKDMKLIVKTEKETE